MINYFYHELENGLKVLVHEDHSTPMAVLNLLYDVGSKDESEDKTGFAHLFEHLMFGGSVNISSFDTPLQKVGGNNNAFTSPDITNYYITVPAQNIETAFWLESDRMLGLSFDPQVLEVQQKVVIEEYKQRYLNQPYGDVWLKLRPLAYTIHPYKWPTIGKEIAHIEEATMHDVKDFFYSFYAPNNAILVIAGPIKVQQALDLANKWFGPIPRRQRPLRNLPAEPKQHTKRTLHHHAHVPQHAIYKSYAVSGHSGARYYATDLLSEMIGRGSSSRLYRKLVKEKNIFSHVSAYITGSIDPGQCVIEGRLNNGVSHQEAEAHIDQVLDEMRVDLLDKELQKVKNQAATSLQLGSMELLNRAMGLAYCTLLGDTELINKEVDIIDSVTSDQIKQILKEDFRNECSSVLYYHAN